MKTLFETKDLSLVKKYIERQFTKIMEDRVSIQDFTFAKEYRGSNSYRPGACVPALSIARYFIVFCDFLFCSKALFSLLFAVNRALPAHCLSCDLFQHFRPYIVEHSQFLLSFLFIFIHIRFGIYIENLLEYFLSLGGC